MTEKSRYRLAFACGLSAGLLTQYVFVFVVLGGVFYLVVAFSYLREILYSKSATKGEGYGPYFVAIGSWLVGTWLSNLIHYFQIWFMP